MRVEGPYQTKLLVALRIGAPLAFVLAALVGSISWNQGSYGLAAINAFIAGMNLVLTWVEWRIFKL